MSLVMRAYEMLRAMEANAITPGGWRVSPDLASSVRPPVSVAEQDVLNDAVTISVDTLRGKWGSWPAGTRLVGPADRMLGLPVRVDEALPPNALILDPTPVRP